MIRPEIWTVSYSFPGCLPEGDEAPPMFASWETAAEYLTDEVEGYLSDHCYRDPAELGKTEHSQLMSLCDFATDDLRLELRPGQPVTVELLGNLSINLEPVN